MRGPGNGGLGVPVENTILFSCPVARALPLCPKTGSAAAPVDTFPVQLQKYLNITRPLASVLSFSKQVKKRQVNSSATSPPCWLPLLPYFMLSRVVSRRLPAGRVWACTFPAWPPLVFWFLDSVSMLKLLFRAPYPSAFFLPSHPTTFHGSKWNTSLFFCYVYMLALIIVVFFPGE
jgi:hypothetical protein